MIWHLNFEIFIFSQPSAQSFNHIFMTNTLKYVDILYFGLILITWKGPVLGFCSMFEDKNFPPKLKKYQNYHFNTLDVFQILAKGMQIVSCMVLRGLKCYLKKKNCQNVSKLKWHKITHKYQKWLLFTTNW